MKKLFTLLMALPLFIHAQEKGDIELGIGAGLNLATFYGDDADDAKVRTSFQAGVTGEYYFNESWGFKTGFIYDSKGAKFDDDDFSSTTKLNYLFIPFYANWHFGMDRNWYLNFGPHLDILLNAKVKAGDEDFDVKDEVKSLDVGLGVGIGYKFQIADNTTLFVEYQGAGGFAKLPEDDEDGSDVFNTRSGFNVGLLFKP